MKLILHVGHNKCGSSTIQSFLKANISKFNNQRIGIVNQFMKISDSDDKNWVQPGMYFHKILFTENKSDIKRDLILLKEEAEIKNLNSIILSDERLSSRLCFNNDKNLLEDISSVFNNIEVIYYIRRQDEYCLSAWQQWGIKQGKSFQEYMIDSYRLKEPDYKLSIEGFKSIFGEHALKVGFINKITLFNENLLSDFISKLGFEDKDFSLVSDANKGIHAGYSDILRRTSKVFGSPVDNEIKKLINKNITNSSDIIYSKEKPVIFYSYSNEIMSFYEKDNIEIHNTYFPNYDFNLLFDKNKYKIKSDKEIFEIEIEQLKNLIAIQNDFIFTMINRNNKNVNAKKTPSIIQRIKSRLR